jgi:hypothetical protein
MSVVTAVFVNACLVLIVLHGLTLIKRRLLPIYGDQWGSRIKPLGATLAFGVFTVANGFLVNLHSLV